MRLAAYLIATLVGSTTAHAATELITNGSFEADDIPTNTISALNPTVTGWNGVAFLFDGDPSGIWPNVGNTGPQYADIGNNTASVASQAFTVAAGDVIQSITWFDNVAQSGAQTSTYTVRLLDGANSVLLSEGFSSSFSDTVWGAQSLSLNTTYGAGSYILEMFGVTGISTNDTLVDDVSVLATAAPVPLPASLPLLGLAIAGAGVLARKRNPA